LGMAQVADEEIRQPTVASRACQPLSAVSRLPARPLHCPLDIMNHWEPSGQSRRSLLSNFSR
jgi:hypothetical protein